LTVPLSVTDVVPASLADPVATTGAETAWGASTAESEAKLELPLPLPPVLPEPVADDAPELPVDVDVDAGHPSA
jgi:hypothetical protein